MHRYSSDGVEQEAASSDDDDGEDEFNSTWARGLRRKKMISAIQEGGENRIRMVGAVHVASSLPVSRKHLVATLNL